MFLVLSALLPSAFVLGLASRRGVPTSAPLSALGADSAPSYEARWMRDELWEKEQLRTRLLEDFTHPKLALEVAASDPIVRPDVLLYWVAGNPEIGDSLPNDATLLGAWIPAPPRAVELPKTVNGAGRLILYSLADHEIVNLSKPFTIP